MTSTDFAAPTGPAPTTVLLLGSGELGKEVAIELQRLGIRVVAADRYADAPAMQVAHEAYVVNMLDPTALRELVEQVRPRVVVPEVEAIATEVLVELETDADWELRVAPTAAATSLTMNRRGIRQLAAETLQLPTSRYKFVSSEEELTAAVNSIGVPCIVKPIMSSSGKGQTTVRSVTDCSTAWQYAQDGARGGTSEVQECIVEGFVDFDEEITLLTVRSVSGTTFLEPIHHVQVDGDYAESWQVGDEESSLSSEVLLRCQNVAREVTDALGGYGVFGVELFIKGDEVIFSEVSPRPHDTGLVTLVSQDLSEFALHARAVLELPTPNPTRFPGAAVSVPIKVSGSGVPSFGGVDAALAVDPSVQVRLFGKPSVDGERRVGVVLARGTDLDEARSNARAAAQALRATLICQPENQPNDLANDRESARG